MSKREVIAYAITHAPKGVKGGPYEGCGAIGGASAHLGCALRWPDAGGGMWARDALASVRRSVPTARVIRIVRARPSAEPTQQPSEASAVAVLRELVAWDDQPRGEIRPFAPIIDRARRVLAAAGPDPSEVVRAAMRYLDHGDDGRLGSAWVKFREAVDAYRKAGGK
ncbi:MAG: hypothetical protein IPQ09_31005 [Myxococcales bacterium]|nr:hypothetical protein [Myxococcales bacterium]